MPRRNGLFVKRVICCTMNRITGCLFLTIFFVLFEDVVGPSLAGRLRQPAGRQRPQWIYSLKQDSANLKRYVRKHHVGLIDNIKETRVTIPHLELPDSIENKLPIAQQLDMPYRGYEIYLLDHPVPSSDSIAAEESVSYYDSRYRGSSSGAVRTASHDPMLYSSNRAAILPFAVKVNYGTQRPPLIKLLDIP